MEQKKITALGIVHLLVYILMVTVNALANILPINGVSTEELSDAYPNLFVPIGFTFAVWGAIYLLLAFFVLFQLGAFGGHKSRHVSEQLDYWFIVSCIANTSWIFAWHYYQIELSLALMLLLLVSLIAIFLRLTRIVVTAKEYFFVKLPFQIYFGWITVATIANVTALLVDRGWTGWGLSETFWTIAVIAVGTVIAISVILKGRAVAYGLTVIWAFAGIIAKHVSANGFASAYPQIIIAAAVGIALLFLACIYKLFDKNKKISVE